MSGKVYENLDELLVDDFVSNDRKFFAPGIDRLPIKWAVVLEVNGDYAPEQPF